MAQTNVPSGFGGGLVRYNEEYNSKLKFSPSIVIAAIILVAAAVIVLKEFFPIQA